MSRKVTDLQPWECLMKRMVWRQLGDIRGKRILDFGSGIGVVNWEACQSRALSSIQAPTDTMLICETRDGSDYVMNGSVGETKAIWKIHGENVNMILCDGHVEAIDIDNIKNENKGYWTCNAD